MVQLHMHTDLERAYALVGHRAFRVPVNCDSLKLPYLHSVSTARPVHRAQDELFRPATGEGLSHSLPLNKPFSLEMP